MWCVGIDVFYQIGRDSVFGTQFAELHCVYSQKQLYHPIPEKSFPPFPTIVQNRKSICLTIRSATLNGETPKVIVKVWIFIHLYARQDTRMVGQAKWSIAAVYVSLDKKKNYFGQHEKKSFPTFDSFSYIKITTHTQTPLHMHIKPHRRLLKYVMAFVTMNRKLASNLYSTPWYSFLAPVSDCPCGVGFLGLTTWLLLAISFLVNLSLKWGVVCNVDTLKNIFG